MARYVQLNLCTIISLFFSAQILCPVVKGDFCVGFTVKVPRKQVQRLSARERYNLHPQKIDPLGLVMSEVLYAQGEP